LTITVHVHVTPTSNTFDLIAIDLLNPVAPVRIVTVYRPPAIDNDLNAFYDTKLLIDSLSHLCDVDFSVIINGDFILPNINWSDPVLVSSRDYCSTLFSTFVNQHAVEQYVSENTQPSTTMLNQVHF